MSFPSCCFVSSSFDNIGTCQFNSYANFVYTICITNAPASDSRVRGDPLNKTAHFINGLNCSRVS